VLVTNAGGCWLAEPEAITKPHGIIRRRCWEWQRSNKSQCCRKCRRSPKAHQHVILGAIQSQCANVYAPVHSADQCVLKKVENHAHSVALFAMYYNFVRIHKMLRTTPAMAAKVTERLWEIGDIVNVLEAWEAAK
jgi:hypothetical protein